MLVLNNIKAIYNGVVQALNGISLRLNEDQFVILLGNNGSGKSTTLKSISGVLRVEDGDLSEGTIELDGERIDRMTPEAVATRGICHVLQERSVFPQLNTEENLLIGAYLRHDKDGINRDLTKVYEYFPALAPLKTRKSGFLSGGEQQMLVIGRALMSRPRIMLLDEPSMGLSPNIMSDLFSILSQINKEEKTSLLVAEQNVTMALAVADYGYVLQNGKVETSGDADSLSDYAGIKHAYLGLNAEGNFISRHRSQEQIIGDDKNDQD